MAVEIVLKSKIIKNPIIEFKKELGEIADSNLLSKLLFKKKLKKEVAEFGLQLLKLKDNYTDQYVSLGSKQVTVLEKWIKDDLWEDSHYYDLLIYFFGTYKAKYVKKAWDSLPQKMYQSGYDRRSFRAPHNRRYLIVNQVNFLRSLIVGSQIHNYHDGATYYNLSFEEQIRYDTEITNASSQFMVWSAAIDSGDGHLYELFEAIIYNTDGVGKVSRNIIKALLNSNKKEAWQLVEKLLLAAQRQEGLRQTIVEALDETSVGALVHMINVIVDNKLTRFSSVVRAIGTWTGLGWESEKETTVRNIIQLAASYFSKPESIETGIRSNNNNEVYMALWVQGVHDIEKTIPYLQELLLTGTIEKKCLALKFAGETHDPYIEMPLYFKALNDSSLQVLAFAIPRMNGLLEANAKSKYYIDNEDYPNFFDKIYHLAQTVHAKNTTFEGKVFSWLDTKFEKDSLYAAAINLIGDNTERLNKILAHFESFSIELREKLTRKIFGEKYSHSYHNFTNNNQNETELPTDFQKSFALRIIKDRGEFMVGCALRVLSKVTLNEDELGSFHELFKRKNASLKKSLISIVLQQSDDKIASLVETILNNGDVEQRLSALDIMLQLQKKDKLSKEVNTWIKEHKALLKITERELKFIEQLSPDKNKEVLSLENGYGFYNPNKISDYALPKPESNALFLTATKKEKFGFSKSPSQIKEAVSLLYELFEANKNHEYEVENYDNSKETVLLGNSFSPLKKLSEKATTAEKAINYPLLDVWSTWFENSKLEPRDLFLLTLVSECNNEDFKSVLQNYIYFHQKDFPNPIKNGYNWNHPIIRIIQALQLAYPFTASQEFLIDACSTLFSALPKSVLNFKYKPKKYEYYYSTEGDGWQNQGDVNVFLNALNLEILTEDQKIKVWNLYRWRQFSGLKENVVLSKPPIYLYCVAFEHQLITKEELYEGILDRDRIAILTAEKKHYKQFGSENLIANFPFLTPMLKEIRDAFLDIEVKRGDSNTTVSHLVQNFQKIYGIQRFAELLSGLGKSSLYKGYIYSWGSTDLNKQKLFSYLLKRCYSLESDTQEIFNEAVQQGKFTEERLVQAAIYAPQWQKLVSNYLGWKGLDCGIWWLHAHTKTAAYGEVNSELESEVAKYSAIDLQDFKDGAVDKDWFLAAYKSLGKAKWEILYESAKFVTDGNGHRRARLYADTLTGDLKIREVTAKVKEKRDQDYLRVYGLVPLSKVNPEKDVLARYEYLQQFKKESKEFGSMKQTSEALAIRIALENLARNADYPDPVRLTWAMETKQIQKILSNETEVNFDGVTIGLTIDKEGKAELVTSKEGKLLKAIPAKLKKEPAVLELGKHRKTMREQWIRSKKGLEEAMIRGDEFLFSEMKNLFQHPVISKHLEKLVFISNTNQIGFYVNENLVNAQGELTSLSENATFRIAHCYDLHQHNVWNDFQKYSFDHKLKQPFKQLFRELYVPTPDELKEQTISRRYAGHQVNPKQTLALLKNKAWKVDYEEGLQKVFHKEGYQVKLYAVADWFSPADVESPTLETIEFISLKGYKSIPFSTINPRIFSEVMRDVDLVVSVAHVGGVDPEASHSSIEMRTVLLRETLRLFKINNVELKSNHALIEGKLAKYSVHLGSAIVHQVPGKYLSILPVHSQHRGRLFLPFADDDPKSAEVLSKVILLAKDNEIQDPTILTQIDKFLN